MSVTTVKSAQVAAIDTGGLANWRMAAEFLQGIWAVPFDFAQGATAGDQNSFGNLCYLPPGRRRVLLGISMVDWSAMTSGAIQIGFTDFVGRDGVTVTGVANAFLASTTTTSAGRLTMTAATWYDYNSRDAILVQAKFSGSGGAPAAATLKGIIIVTEP